MDIIIKILLIFIYGKLKYKKNQNTPLGKLQHFEFSGLRVGQP